MRGALAASEVGLGLREHLDEKMFQRWGLARQLADGGAVLGELAEDGLAQIVGAGGCPDGQPLPAPDVDAAGEVVRVVGGLGDEGEDVAVARIDEGAVVAQFNDTGVYDFDVQRWTKAILRS